MKALWKKAISKWKALSFGRKLRCVAIAVLICLVAVVVRRSVEEQKKWDREYEASYTEGHANHGKIWVHRYTDNSCKKDDL